MRRKYFGLAIAALATLGPMQAWGGDREIAEQIIQRLKANRDSGVLKDFTLDMKVDQGVVLFRGNVSQSDQKALVLDAANGIEGIAKIVDELAVTTAATVVKPKANLASVSRTPVGQASPATNNVAAAESTEVSQSSELVAADLEPAASESDFSFRNALAAQAKAIASSPVPVMPGEIRPASALETSDDDAVVAAVVSALGRAKEAGQLRGFGLDVKSNDGVLQIVGRAASETQRNTILRIAESVPGVAGIRESIAVPTVAPELAELPAINPQARANPMGAMQMASQRMPAQPVGQQANMGGQTMTAPYRMQGQPMPAQQAGFGMGMGAPVVGQPVPMAPHSAVGAPRYDSPNLPNYAWPGYAAHPNYAAVTYPQQYSPSAWPYIGPFYPYPQVPLGWRKVSLEWDDGWWFLDFTDR